MEHTLIRSISVIGLVAVGSGVALGCDHEHRARTENEAYVGPAHPTDAPALPGSKGVDSARHEIVAARCEREERCSNIGSGKDFDNMAACRSKLDGKTESDLNTNDCKHGVDRGKLSECLAKIRDEDCGNPIDSLSRVTACRTGAICIDS
jgi:hypothetical protein